MTARRVRELRRSIGWSAQRLAAECAKVGATAINRNMISNLENGRRESISLEELLTFAVVLGVPLAALIVDETAEKMTVAGQEHLVLDVLLWLAAEPPLDFTTTGRRSERFQQAAAPVQAARGFHLAIESVTNGERFIAQALEAGEATEMERAERLHRRSLVFLSQSLIEMQSLGMTLPRVPDEWRTDAKRFEIDLPGQED